MACVNSDGKLTESAKNVLKSVAEKPKTVNELSEETSLPLFKIRSSLRDMVSMGMVSESDGLYKIDAGGKKLLEKSAQ